MFESSDRPPKANELTAMGQSKQKQQQQQQHFQPTASTDNGASSLISSSSSCSRSNSSSNTEGPALATSTSQTPATTTRTTTTTTPKMADDTTTSSSSPSPQDQDNQRSFLAIVQTQLAWQLAYYFSPANLAADTYLKTLQSLNDGAVPVNILANFGKIQAILSVTPCLRRVYLQSEAARAEALVQAVQLNPDCGLQVVQVDADTGKVVVDTKSGEKDDDKLKDKGAADSSNVRTLRAIRPVQTTQATAEANSNRSFTNCVLLRDVNPSVTEADIRELMDRLLQLEQEQDGSSFYCPPILRIQCDVAHCWLIWFDTTDRDTMLRVVLQLRTLTLKGNYVHARLKSSSSSPPPPSSTVSNVVHHPHAHHPTTLLPPPSVDRAAAVAAAATQLGIPLQKKKNRRRGRKKKKTNAENVTDDKKEDDEQLPPSLEDFPTLHDNTVEWAAPLVDVDEREVKARHGHHHDDDEEEEPSSKSSNKAHSDAASTATTTSSSMESVPKKALAGYAAAVLKNNNNNNSVSEVGARVRQPEESSATQAPTQVNATVSDTDSPSDNVVIQPPTWGRGRSFADAAKASS